MPTCDQFFLIAIIQKNNVIRNIIFFLCTALGMILPCFICLEDIGKYYCIYYKVDTDKVELHKTYYLIPIINLCSWHNFKKCELVNANKKETNFDTAVIVFLK